LFVGLSGGRETVDGPSAHLFPGVSGSSTGLSSTLPEPQRRTPLRRLQKPLHCPGGGVGGKEPPHLDAPSRRKRT